LKKYPREGFPFIPSIEKVPPKRILLHLTLKKVSPKKILFWIPFEKISPKKRIRLSDLKKMDQKRIHGRRMNPILATNGLGDEAPIHAPTKEGIQAGVE